jgi:cellobiose-specific phosphotransferase system component IIC
MQPANPRFLQMLVLIFGSMLAPMVLMVPTSFAYGVPMLLAGVFGISMDWLYLLLSIAQLVLTWFAYLWTLKQLDGILWKREPAILDIVANIPE